MGFPEVISLIIGILGLSIVIYDRQIKQKPCCFIFSKLRITGRIKVRPVVNRTNRQGASQRNKRKKLYEYDIVFWNNGRKEIDSFANNAITFTLPEGQGRIAGKPQIKGATSGINKDDIAIRVTNDRKGIHISMNYIMLAYKKGFTVKVISDCSDIKKPVIRGTVGGEFNHVTDSAKVFDVSILTAVALVVLVLIHIGRLVYHWYISAVEQIPVLSNVLLVLILFTMMLLIFERAKFIIYRMPKELYDSSSDNQYITR